MLKTFTQDWFSGNIPRFNEAIGHLKDKEDLSFLEIGSFEGRSTCWLLDNILTGKNSNLYCVDTFLGGYDHTALEINFNSVYDLFKKNTEEYGDRVKICRGKSFDMLNSDELKNKKFDFIYIDGSHIAKEVMEDIVLSFKLLKQNGIMIFDDYMWWDPNPANHHLGRPADAIEFFIKFYMPFIEVLETGYQVVIRKIGEEK